MGNTADGRALINADPAGSPAGGSGPINHWQFEEKQHTSMGSAQNEAKVAIITGGTVR